jgi:chromosome segregation ATPase
VCRLRNIRESHGSIVDVFDEKKKGFERKMKDLRENIRMKHADQGSKIEKKIADLEKEFTTLLHTVSEHGEELKREIDEIVKQLHSEIEIRKNHLELLKTARTEVKENLTEIDKELSSLKETLDSNDINKVFQFTPKNKDYENLPEESLLTIPIFCAKKINSVQLRELFGTLSNITTKPIPAAHVKLMEKTSRGT